MKNRLLGVVIMLIVTIPCLLIGGIPFKILAILISILSLKEFLDVTKIPKLVKISSYLAMLFLYFNNLQLSNIKIISLMLLIFFIFIIYYHDNKKYNVMDAIYLVTSIFLIYIPCSYIIDLRNTNINIFIYLILITTMTDTYAYITGYLIGKHKLIEEISPNKTIEGLIGGIFGGTFIPIIFYMVKFNSINVPLLILQTVVLSLLGQFGDLFFSSIKRQYKIKDFSNLIPGHGGILDRIDSLIFVVLGYLIFI